MSLTPEQHALDLDRRDPLAPFRERFYVPPGVIYLDGNSLGLLSRDAEQAVLRVLGQWQAEAIGGYSLPPESSWYYTGEELGRRMAPLVGAGPDEVVVTGTTTVNLHQMLATFYRPSASRRRLLATALDFPSDIYALQSQLRLHGLDPDRDLLRVPSRDGHLIEEDDVLSALNEEVALAVLPSVLYRSGQLLDIERVTAAAHRAGALVCWDCSHSVGVVPHRLHDAGVDCAVWCTYKYLNAGPGAAGALFVHRKHHGALPGLAGWWGGDKQKQFDMAHTFTPAPDAGAWQISSCPQLAAAPLRGSLDIHAQAGIERIRAKSLSQTGYLMSLLEGRLDFANPRAEQRRGGHVALVHGEADRIGKVLRRVYRVIPDFRPPNILRLAPIPLYTRYHDIWQAAQYLLRILDRREYEQVEPGRDLIA